MLLQVNNEEMGSPVDVAKSYMQARPPWASPSTSNFEFKSPSPLGLQLFKEETSYSISGNPLSSSKVPFYPLNYTHDTSLEPLLQFFLVRLSFQAMTA